jgi:hypothetical protein
MSNLYEVLKDGEVILVPEELSLHDLIPDNISSVNYLDGSQLKTTKRSEAWKSMPVPKYISTNITPINKG